MHNRMYGILLLLGLCAALLISGCNAVGGNTQPTPLPPVKNDGNVTAEGRVVPRDSAVLAFLASGPVDAILVSEGSMVASGTELINLGNREQALGAVSAARMEQLAARQALDKLERLADLSRSQAQMQLSAAEKTLITAQKAFDDLDTDQFREDLDTKEIAVQDAQTAVDDAQKELDKYKDLDPDNSTRKNAEQALEDAQQDLQNAKYERDLLKNTLDQATAALDVAKDGEAEARRAYEARLNGADEEELALLQARLENAGRQLAAAERMLDNFALKAPYDGQVMEIKNLKVGEWVTPAQPAVVFADVSAWYVETKDLNELEVVKLEVGQSATIVPDALKDVSLSGTVEWIGETFSEKSGDVLYTVRVKLDAPDSRLRWGMTVKITFQK